MREFKCHICLGMFKVHSEPCLHYKESERDEEGEISLCDTCCDSVQKSYKNPIHGHQVSSMFFKHKPK